MKQLVKTILLFCKSGSVIIMCILLSGCTMPDGQKIELNTTEAILTIANNGNLTIKFIDNQSLGIRSDLDSILKIIVTNIKDKSEFKVYALHGQIVENSDSELKILYEICVNQLESSVIKAEMVISVEENAFCFSGTVSCESDKLNIKNFTFPVFEEISYPDSGTNVFWPNSLGERFSDLLQFGSRSFDYPSTSGSMPWFTINSGNHGIYIGCHDQERGSKTFRLEYLKNRNSFSSSVSFPVFANKFIIPPVMIKPYSGSWHIASKYYRSWFDTYFSLPVISDWMRDNAGLMLTILKQQNGSVMWHYNDIEKLCDIAEKLNIRLIGLWGWAIGGHDRLYPDYTPDELLGGMEKLKKAISAARKRGFKIIVYSNGTIMDASTEFYRTKGIETIQMNEKKQPNIEFYLKHSNTSPVILARACPGSSLWRNTILGLAQNAKSLGVDAFYIDQVGVRVPFLCFSDKHDHILPQEAYTKYRFKMMHDIRASMKETDPEFSIITEGTVDALLPEIDVFHGLGPGSIITPNSFAEMFRYTFPESIIIQLNPSPALTRYDANYAAVYGLRHEIMCRYEPDAEYLKSGHLPSQKDYSDLFINDPPSVKKITEAPAAEVSDYVHKLIEFENRYGLFFRRGKFIDQDGIKITGEDIVAKGFLSGNKLAVVVWNRNLSEVRNYSVEAEGYKLKGVAEPGNTEGSLSDGLDANSLRMLIFEKN
ncbi:MAG: hypothetical protein IPN68_19885 [Bacteroidetes bacterium]|nr:hypothetical protein [Bacteroidota bacterium]